MPRTSKRRILCPRCHKIGFISERWVDSTYFPKYASLSVIMFEESLQALSEKPHDAGNSSRHNYWKSMVRGNAYRDTSEGKPPEERQIPYRGSWFRVTYARYSQYYVAHYDSNKYKKQLIDYKLGKRKSRPNGRRECKLRNCDLYPLGLYSRRIGWPTYPMANLELT